MPEHLVDSLNEVKNTPIGAIAAPITGAVPGLLSNVATFTRDTTPTNLNEANMGMLPMAIGEPGGEQNAALARAAVGGLLFATPTTLLLVPYLFATLRIGADGKAALGNRGRPGRHDRSWRAFAT
jgi:hypothetical protein